jgi:hypothetical protein
MSAWIRSVTGRAYQNSKLSKKNFLKSASLLNALTFSQSIISILNNPGALF